MIAADVVDRLYLHDSRVTQMSNSIKVEVSSIDELYTLVSMFGHLKAGESVSIMHRAGPGGFLACDIVAQKRVVVETWSKRVWPWDLILDPRFAKRVWPWDLIFDPRFAKGVNPDFVMPIADILDLDK